MKKHSLIFSLLISAMSLVSCDVPKISIEDAEAILKSLQESYDERIKSENKISYKWYSYTYKKLKTNPKDEKEKEQTYIEQVIYSKTNMYFHKFISNPNERGILTESWEFVEGNSYYKAKKVVNKVENQMTENRTYCIRTIPEDKTVLNLWDEFHDNLMNDITKQYSKYLEYGQNIINEAKNPTIDENNKPSFFEDANFASYDKKSDLIVKGIDPTGDKSVLRKFEIKNNRLINAYEKENEQEEKIYEYSYDEKRLDQLDIKNFVPHDRKEGDSSNKFYLVPEW